MARARASSSWVLSRSAPPSADWSEQPEFYVTASESPVGVPLEGFAEKKDAEAARKSLERAAREQMSIGPFLRSLIPDGLSNIVAAAKAANLPPPDVASLGPAVGPKMVSGYETYGGDYFEYIERAGKLVLDWWASVAAGITPEANATLWDKLFPDFQFFVVNRVLFEG